MFSLERYTRAAAERAAGIRKAISGMLDRKRRIMGGMLHGQKGRQVGVRGDILHGQRGRQVGVKGDILHE